MTTIYRMTMEESRCEAVSPGAGISLLTLRGKSLLSWAKAAHSSGHLLRRFLQRNHLLSLLLVLLVLSVLTLFTVMEYSKLEQIDFGTTIHASFDELKPIHIPFSRASAPGQ